MIPTSHDCLWLAQSDRKFTILIFFRAMVFLGYAAHWSMKSKVFPFLSLSGDPIAYETPQM
jgi:hypothetical protein